MLQLLTHHLAHIARRFYIGDDLLCPALSPHHLNAHFAVSNAQLGRWE